MTFIAHWSGDGLHEDVALVVGDAGGAGLYCRVCSKRWRLDALLDRVDGGQESGDLRAASDIEDFGAALEELEAGFRAVIEKD